MARGKLGQRLWEGVSTTPILSTEVQALAAGVQAPSGALTAWATVAQKAANQQVVVMHLGDSISQGAKATHWYTQGWSGLVRTGLLARYGALAGEYVPAADNVVLATGIDSPSVQCTFAGTSGLGSAPMTGYSLNRTLAINDTIIFTPINGFTDFDLILNTQNGWAAFTLKVDGVLQTASVLEYVDNNGAFQTAASSVLSFNSTAADGQTTPHRWTRYRGWSGGPFAAGTHTITLTATSNAQCNIGGVQIYPHGRTANGLVFVKHALFGKTARDLGFDPFQVQFPNYSPRKASISDWKPAPHLVIIELGINDTVNGWSNSLLALGLDNLCREAMRVGATVVFVAPYWETAATWHSSGIATILNLARTYNAVVVNGSSLFGNTDAGAATYVTSAGDSHPNTAGHALLAQAVLSVL